MNWCAPWIGAVAVAIALFKISDELRMTKKWCAVEVSNL